MRTRTYCADERPVGRGTLVEIFFEAIDRHGEMPALQYMLSESEVRELSYLEVFRTVKRLCGGLRAMGLERGERVAILSENRPEWALADYACLCAGLIPVPIYPSLLPAQVAYLLENSGARLVLASTAGQMTKAIEAAELAKTERSVDVVVFDEVHGRRDGVACWTELLERGDEWAAATADEEFRADAGQAGPDDVATVLYTSGTTGTPKGVMLTHDNISSNARACGMVLDIYSTDNTVSFLPLSHILQRMVDYLLFWRGCTIGYPRSIDTLVADMKVLRPTLVVSVPRIYEKIYNRVMGARGLRRRLLDWAVGVADRVATVRLRDERPGALLAAQYAVADRLVFRKIRGAVGGRLRFFVSGGGPLAPALNRFFYSIGMVILEGYGLTETSPVTNVNTVEHFRIGTVGKPVPSTEIKIAADGEILVRGPQVMKGYYRNPEATAEVIDENGWFSTGDIGEIDDDGFLSITDRKKDLLVTAGGKNVAPQPVENVLATHELVEQVVMVGDRRRYCSLLVVPAFPALEAWARSAGITWSDREELTRNPKVIAHVEREIEPLLERFASFERPKKVALLPEEFTVENGFLTPTLKVKRREVQARLASVIDLLYAEEAADATEY
jgi:long-chain acyl-CoA synthetase